MPVEIEGQLTFTFPNGWRTTKFDDWSYYRNQFGPMRDHLKAIDILAFSPNNCLWLIEIKDYRQHRRTKSSDLAEEVAQKVLDTLAALLPARIRANDDAEAGFARAATGGLENLRVVLHLEQPTKTSKLFPRAIDPANIQQKLKKRLKPIDPHPRVVETGSMDSLDWAVG